MFGKSPTLDQAKIKALDEASTKELITVQADSKRGAFVDIAILPAFMLLCALSHVVLLPQQGWRQARGHRGALETLHFFLVPLPLAHLKRARSRQNAA